MQLSWIRVLVDGVRIEVVFSLGQASPQRSLTGKLGSTTKCRRRVSGEHAKEILQTEGFLRT